MTVAENAVNRDFFGKVPIKIGITVKTVGVGHSRKRLRVNSKDRADLTVPGKGTDIEKLCTGSVGVIASEFFSVGHLKDEPRINRAAAKVSAGKVASVPENPCDLCRREIWREPQTCVLAHHFGIIRQSFTDLCTACALPYDRIINRKAGIAIPNQSRLALVADADANDFVFVDAGFFNNSTGNAFGVLPDFHRIMRDPSVF